MSCRKIDKKDETEIYNIYIVSDYDEWTIREIDNENENSWDRIDTDRAWHFKRLSGTRGDESLMVSFKPEEDKTYYVLLAIYSTGDSFGHDSHHRVEYFDIYENSTDAYLAEKELNSNAGNSELEFTNHQKKKVKFYNPWNGHFESLDEIRIEYLTYHIV